MRFSTFISLTLVAITSLSLFACGGGGGGGGGGATVVPTTPALTADKMTALTPVLINGTTTITFTFGAAYNGLPVTFTVSPANATLTNKSTEVIGGTASVTVSYPTQQNVTVTASIPGYTGTKTVQFIPQPDKVVVHVATTRTITDLAILTFGLRTNPTVDCPYTLFTPATGYSTFSSTLAPPGGDLYSLYIYDFGLNTTPSRNIFEMTFSPAVLSGIPYFEIFTPLSNPINLSYIKYPRLNPDPAVDILSNYVIEQLATTDFVITTDYYLGAALLATN